ncbi:PREDICTED: U-box domain-containing protein 44-like isoform X1 [Ipomoea nil]|uniref:U-box domain-containing protein 44-like isoform X1 n=1 Tax=Ipomoea nil TaxID=35883 RepID=UPI00090093D0|nr:PREDICTED: U-box domain-containing protein 44-like isoform X1 [Ipomoea nil]XP_019159511.1 PREDICTED: U-box domain-containing protein 44-like isoform X2 [Ipomoea nil]XP_019159512.1 PREDICTED: U-box domain-containing protein 44-like isoform X1 [Ipomoea nil]
MDENSKPVSEISSEAEQRWSTDENTTESTSELSVFVEKLSPILAEIQDDKNLSSDPTIQKAIQSLEQEFKTAKALTKNLNIHSSPLKQIDDQTENLGRSLGLVLFASHDMGIARRAEMEALRKEIMNSRSNFCSERESEFSYDLELASKEIVEEEEEEEDRITLDIDGIALQLKYGNDEELKQAIFGLNVLIGEGGVTKEALDNEDIIPILFSRLSTSVAENRLAIIHTLRILVNQNNDSKEKMAEIGCLSTVVKSLTGDVDEQREAVGLLSTLSELVSVRRRLGRIQGCIVMLVAIFNGEDQAASRDAGKLLNALSANTQYALHMAEAGYFKPLVHYLKEGSDMSKVLMATAVSRMELTDKNRASLGEDGAIHPLVKMFSTGNLESKQSALSALQNLSGLSENVQRLVNSGIVATLLQLLFSVTSVLMTLREPASAILAKIAHSEGLLVKPDVAQQMLSLLNLTSPVIQCHLLEALNSIASNSGASKVRRKMKENGAIRLLLPFLTETNAKIRTGALRLICLLSENMQGELTEQMDETHICIIANIVSSVSSSPDEKAVAIGILSNLPVSDKKATSMLVTANLLPALVSLMNSSPSLNPSLNPSPAASMATRLGESIAGVLIRFTVPSDKKLQHFAADQGAIPVLVKLLASSDSITAKSRAATCLTQLSQNSLSLRKPRKPRWFCGPSSTDGFCELHDGYCSVKTTFCLVKAGAITPLVQILEGHDREADEAVLSCLSTLVQDETWEIGCKYLVKEKGVQCLVKVLELGSIKAQEKALWILERVFRIEAYRVEHGECAQPLLIDLAQTGDAILKPTVAKLLAQLELLQAQSSYF